MLNDFQEFIQTIIYQEKQEAGSWVNGFWVEASTIDTEIKAIVQPMTEAKLKYAPEGYRVDNSIVVKTDISLAISSYIVVDSVEYIVEVEKNYRNILPHYEYMCRKV